MGEFGPSDWDKAIEVAKYRAFGYTQREVAAKVGVSAPTISRWENSSWWGQAIEEAKTGEMRELAGRALNTVREAIEEGDVTTARWYLERTEPRLSKSGSGGGSSHNVQVNVGVAGGGNATTEVIEDANGNTRRIEDMSEEELRELAGEDTKGEIIDLQFEEMKGELNAD